MMELSRDLVPKLPAHVLCVTYYSMTICAFMRSCEAVHFQIMHLFKTPFKISDSTWNLIFPNIPNKIYIFNRVQLKFSFVKDIGAFIKFHFSGRLYVSKLITKF